VGAVLRRAKIQSEKKISVCNLTMDVEEHVAYVDGEELPLTVREFNLLFKFLSYPKKTFTRSQLMEEFWDYDSSATSRTVDVYVVKLREKTACCDGFEIVTVHGLGYKAVLK
jgi:DNA-binding response OmpR family regulator